MIKTGSTVEHIPTGEKWFVLGVNTKEDKVCVAGWPPTVARLSDCVEVEKSIGVTAEEMLYRDREFGLNWD